MIHVYYVIYADLRKPSLYTLQENLVLLIGMSESQLERSQTLVHAKYPRKPYKVDLSPPRVETSFKPTLYYSVFTEMDTGNALSEPLGEFVVHLLIFLTIVRILQIPLGLDWSATELF